MTTIKHYMVTCAEYTVFFVFKEAVRLVHTPSTQNNMFGRWIGHPRYTFYYLMVIISKTHN